MAHQVEQMMYAVRGGVPWHGLGVALDHPPTAQEAIVAAGLDWDVELCPILASVADGDCESLEAVAGHRAVRRTSDGAFYAVVSDQFRPLQNREAFSFFDPFLASGDATLEAAGSLRGGSRVWVLAKIAVPSAEVVEGDTVESYVLLSNSHDGSLAVRCGYTNVRVVCQNTLTAAHGEGRLMRIRHTKHVKAAVDDVRDTMQLAKRTFEATVEQYRSLARKGVSADDLRAYVTEVFAPVVRDETEEQMRARLLGAVTRDESDDQMTDRLLGRTPRVLDKVTECFESGRGHELAGSTLWGAYNAVTEYVQHERGTDAAKRLDSAWFGQGEKVNIRAMSIALKRANG